jgi:tRNA/tmRNA/rRNA uracil-C5-methylase (TrmA/RlmC/RlmD family)
MGDSKKAEGTICMQRILRSPQVFGYRNRADFAIGLDTDGKPAAGHFYGLFREGLYEVGSVEAVPQLSPTAKAYAALMTRFLNSDSQRLPAWDKQVTADDVRSLSCLLAVALHCRVSCLLLAQQTWKPLQRPLPRVKVSCAIIAVHPERPDWPGLIPESGAGHAARRTAPAA